MEFNIDGWLNLVIRWTHVITGIAWIGSSFYFNWLDSRLVRPEPARQGIEGELWMVHSGGFYRVEKIDLAPQEMPKHLHWFKWEAGFTWLSGALLLILIYYFEARLFLLDPSVAAIGPALGIAIGIGVIAVAWLVYDVLWQSALAKTRTPVVIAFCLGLLVVLSFGLTQVFSARAAIMHVGAVLGTLMAANVWMRIIPAQQQLVSVTKAGNPADPDMALSAKQRSVHNNYMTLPIVFVMLSSHYPFIIGHQWNWLLMLVLFGAGVAVRHMFNLRNKGRRNHWLVPAAAVAVIGLVVITAQRSDAPDGAVVAFADARAVIAQRCAACHSANPTDEAFTEAPGGVMFDTPRQIKQLAQRINAQAVITRTMPLGNITGMTEEERALLARWIQAGAPVE